jgi:hypothetical protein
MVPEAQTYTLWLAGTGFHGIDGADFTTEQCVTQRGFADAGFPIMPITGSYATNWLSS